MPNSPVQKMRRKHTVLAELAYEPGTLMRGYADKVLRVDLGKNAIEILPVTQQMKDLWIGGKGFDLWLMFQEINKDTKWDSPENVICLSSGPLGGTTSFPGSGKTIVTSISPATESIMDSNVGGYFGPYLKFAGFDAMVLAGKAHDEVIVVIDVPKQMITIEKAPDEALDAHIICEQLTEMYADNEDDKRNIAVVAAGSAADHVWMGILNFSFYDWRRKVTRIKQAGRGGLGTVFRDKKIKALVIKNKYFTPAWSISEQPFADEFKIDVPETAKTLTVQDVHHIVAKWQNKKDFLLDMLLDAQNQQGFISREVIDGINELTRIPKSHLYHIATFYPFFSMKPRKENDRHPDIFVCDVRILPGNVSVTLRQPGSDNPKNKDDARLQEVCKSLKNHLDTFTPDQMMQLVTDSNLRARERNGFSVGHAWQSARLAAEKRKIQPVLICSITETSPGVCIDRTIVENDPYGLVEGLILGAYAVGASEGHISIHHRYKRATDRLNDAIETMRSKGWLGDKINGLNFKFDLYVHHSPGSAVDCEPSAVIEALSGRPGEPHLNSLNPLESGFKKAPTILNNAETWITIPAIIRNGADWFKSLNPQKGFSAGTKVFMLSGALNQTGLAEVPLGTPLQFVLNTWGKGVPNGQSIKAVLIGGPSGGFIPGTKLDIPLDFKTLTDAGSTVGSGDITVFDQSTCMVDMIESYTRYLAGESCGKCLPCREGLQHLAAILKKIKDGKGSMEDLDTIKELAETVSAASLCHFGKMAPNPILTGLRYFREDLMTHVRTGRCPSHQKEDN
ncbi:MAG: aldehyde ferredoxin oxidoreductase N-terminal domain-containing protein [bacterium]